MEKLPVVSKTIAMTRHKKDLEDKVNYNKFCERIPMRRFGESYEIITAALFLASPMSGYITGSDIVVDGGWTSS